MQWIINNKKYIVGVIFVIIIGMVGLGYACQMRTKQIARMACDIQYDEMLGEIQTNTEISELLVQKKDAFCNCWTDVVMNNWTDYALMHSVDIATELVKDTPDETYDCIKVFYQ